jgi:SAM-dependent methyltransferase
VALLRLLDPRPGESLLDVGAGRGQAVRFLAAQVGTGGRVAAVDHDAQAMAHLAATCAAIGPAQVDVHRAEATSLPFEAGSFDAALCVNVLEAVEDRARVLAEMRRVLRPGGRVLVAHDDYDSQAYVCEDRVLGRRVVHAFADARLSRYAASDGQMGRRLWGLFRAAGFHDTELRVLPLVETEYAEPHQGWVLSQFGHGLVAASGLTPEELDRWRRDLAERSARGEFLYCANLYVCTARK